VLTNELTKRIGFRERRVTKEAVVELAESIQILPSSTSDIRSCGEFAVDRSTS
jgi:hypothetical protein